MSLNNLLPWRQSREVSSSDPFYGFQHEMNRLFDDFFKGAPALAKTDEWIAKSSFVPRVNVSEDADKYIIRAELPGLTDKDVKVTLENGVLTLSGEKKSKIEDNKDEKHHRIEHHYGSFIRQFSLPDGIDENMVEARFQNGLLTVQVGKKEEVKPKAKAIEIKSA